MSSDNKSNDTLDSMLADLDSVIGRSSEAKRDRVNLEAPTAAGEQQTYVSLEEREEATSATAEPMFTPPTPPSFDATRVLDDLMSEETREADGDEDMKVFGDERADDKQAAAMSGVSGATQVIAGGESEEKTAAPKEKTKKPRNEALGCLKSIIYVVLVLGLASLMGYYAACAVVDVMGLYVDGTTVRITVEQGDSTQEVAELLKQEKIIEFPLVFRVYCRFTGNDAVFHPGNYVVYRGMDYNAIVDELSQSEMSETVTVTVPEGTSLEGVAELMEENGVCTAEDFYKALETFDYDQYDFFKEISAEQRKDRTYLAEGYLFPDTYEFYLDDAASSVIERMIDNFEARMSDAFDTIKASGRTVDEIVTAASIVQREAGNGEDMPRVMRVILNRLDNPSSFPRLEMDSTQDYLEGLEHINGAAYKSAYDTYAKEGMPVGAIGNPGLQALNAAINPSQEPEILNCYYFASIVEKGTTAFFETFEEHEAYCIEHGIGMYG